MAEVIEQLSFRSARITVHFRNGTHEDLGGPVAAVQLLRDLAEARLPISVVPGDAVADGMARHTADLAGMRLEERSGRLFLLRPGRQPEEIELPEGAAPLVREAPKPEVRGPVVIALSPGLFTDSEVAFQEVIRRSGSKPPPKRFHNFGTGTLLSGSTPAGRVQALYKNLRDYGPAVMGDKLRDWARYIETSPDEMDRTWLRWFRDEVDPRDIETIGGRDQVLPYFKAWVLLRVLAQHT